MAEIINLRLAKKRISRNTAEKAAKENRARYGASKASSKAVRMETERAHAAHEGARLNDTGASSAHPSAKKTGDCD